MADRRRIPREVELSVLDRSRRRCCLCFQLNGDLDEKHGQIAHLDKNPGNPAEDNLGFLCLRHHSLFDSKTSQHKNYTPDEAKAARARLYEAISQDLHLNANPPIARMETDRATLADLIEIMTPTIEFLKDASFDGCSYEWKVLGGISCLRWERQGPEHEFVNPELEELRTALLKHSGRLVGLLSTHTFSIEGREERLSVLEDLEIDDPERYGRVVEELDTAAKAVCSCYYELVRTARKRLMK